ncbi:restriction endonuclease subunit S [Salinisphaera orenii]|uniref:restriction endonuclease subunit S n=1 Tax=Salinisphaera orenii TaxID=856731 RepID=UPI000DBE3747
MSFPHYDEYKDSDVTWLGEVPSHWNVDRIKHSTESCRNGIWGSEAQDDENDIPCIRVADFDWSRLRVNSSDLTIRNVLPGEQKHRILRPGNLILEKSGGGEKQLVGRVVLYEYNWPAVCSNFTARVVLKTGMVPSYWKYLHAAAYDVRLNYRSIKQTSGIQNLDQQSYFDERCGYPPHDEQRAIARLLDHETAKIDALVAEQKRLIELLKEKRQAIISHAVTKGLDPNVPMKDSGVEWLGAVPKHWLVGSLRWYSDVQGGIAKGKDYAGKDVVEMPYLRVANVQNGHIDLTDVAKIAVLPGDLERYALRDSDVLMNEGGDNDKLGRGAVWHAEIDPCLHQNHVFAIRPGDHLRAEWLALFTASASARSYFYLYSKQSTNLASISSSNVMSCPVPLPHTTEQEQILKDVKRYTESIDEMAAEASKAVDLLTERRSALISAAVTGKIDVRDWQPLTDESAAGSAVQSTEANA